MCKTLIVEDSAAFRKTFREALTGRFSDMEIMEAENGSEALELIESCRPDIVFMDIRLPGENGLALTEKIKKSNPEIIVVILTQYDLPEYRTAAFANGADQFIPKGSVNMAEIVDIIDSLVVNP